MGQTPISAALQRTLRLHDGMAGAERSFRAESGTATVSACGPLLAGPQHVGNLRQYVVLDVLRRVLAAAGYEVADAMLLTDVWRPRAGRNAPASDAAAGKFREMFAADLEDLGVRLPQHLGDVPNQIGDHLALIARLEALGLTYRTADGLYYDTSLWPGYGRLSPMPAGKADRPVARDGKRHEADFALWRLSSEGVGWDSPWGRGIPGWHIQCTSTVLRFLGDTVDVHLGSVIHRQIHHNNMIAQAEPATGRPFARFWLHVGATTEHGGRMMTREGDLVTLEALRRLGYQPLDVRYLVLLTHYRGPLEFSLEALDQAARARARLGRHLDVLRQEAGGAGPPEVDPASGRAGRFLAALADDLHTPRALAALWEIVRADDLPPAGKLALLDGFVPLLGLDGSEAAPGEAPSWVRHLAEERHALRAQRRFREADALRAEIRAGGYDIVDGEDGFAITRLPVARSREASTAT